MRHFWIMFSDNATCQLGGCNPMCEDTELDLATALCLGLRTCILCLLSSIQVQDIKRLLQGLASCYPDIEKVSSCVTKSTSDKSVESSATPRPVEA